MMIAVSFTRESDGRYIRELLLPGQPEPLHESVSLPELYPGRQYSWETSLEERPDLPELGHRLFAVALGETGQEIYHQRRTQGVQLRFREQPDLPEVAALPWEILHDGRQFVALDARTPVIREIQDLPPFDRVAYQKPLRVLLVWAAPRDQSPLEVEREQIALSLALGRFIQSGQIVVHEIIRATQAKLDEALSLHRYDLFYFTGHGVHHSEKGGFICLEDEQGQTDLLPAVELARLLSLNFPPLIFLNCCQSAAAGAQAAPGRWFTDVGRYLLTEGASDVVGTLTPIFDVHGRLFGDTFFRLFLSRPEAAKAVIQGRGALFGKDWEKELRLPPEKSRLFRQSFFQFLHLSRSLPETELFWEEAPALRDTAGRHHYVSLNRPVLTGREVQRNALMDRVEALWRRGRKVVGVYGLGGLGKTFFSVQASERLVRHPDPNLAVEATLWLDLRDKTNAGALVEEVAQLLSLTGAPQLAQALRQEASPNPMLVARLLAQAFGGQRLLLVLDNCETLDQVEEAEKAGLRDLFLALAGHTPNWPVLLTSRERLDLSQNGREPVAVDWMSITELTFSERAALFLTAQEIAAVQVPEKHQELVLREVAGHPYELTLFLRDLAPGADIPALVHRVHQQTGEYAALDYYVGQLPVQLLHVLQTLALFRDPPDRKLFVEMWEDLAAAVGWPNAGDPEDHITSLQRRGLVSEEEWLAVPPVLASYLLRQDTPHRLHDEIQQQLNFELAKIYGSLAQAVKKIMAKVFEHEVEEASQLLHTLHRQRLDFLHRGLRQALEQSDPLLQSALLSELSDESRGSLAHTLLAAYARRLAAALKAHPEAAGEHIGSVYHELGRMYQNQRQWKEALESYQEALEWFEKTQQWHQLGSTYHQIGRVNEEKRQWPEALGNYQKALKWNEKTQQWHYLGITHHQIGMVYVEQQLWKEALDSYQQALAWKEKTQQWHQLGGTHHQIGMVYVEQQLWKEALDSYQQSLVWKEKTQQWQAIGSTYHEIGIVYHKQRQWPEAMKSYQQALEWDEKTQQWHELGGTHHQIGMVYEEQGLWSEALESYQQALEWKEKTQQWYALGGTYHQIGMVFEEQGLWQKALETYLTAFDWLVKTEAHDIDICLGSLVRLAKKVTEAGALDQMPPELMAKLATILRSLDKET